MSFIDRAWRSISRFLAGEPAGSGNAGGRSTKNTDASRAAGGQDGYQGRSDRYETQQPTTGAGPQQYRGSSGRSEGTASGVRQHSGSPNITSRYSDTGRRNWRYRDESDIYYENGRPVMTEGGEDEMPDDQGDDQGGQDDDGGDTNGNGGNDGQYPQEVDKDRPHRNREYDVEMQPGAYDRYSDRYEFKQRRRPEITLLELGDDEEGGVVDVGFNEFVTQNGNEYAELMLRTERPQNRRDEDDDQRGNGRNRYRHILESVPIRENGRGRDSVNLGRYHEDWKEINAYGIKKDNGWLNSDSFELHFEDDELYEVHTGRGSSSGGLFGFL